MSEAALDPEQEEVWYTVPHVAGVFAVSAETIRNWIERGDLKAFKTTPGGRWRIARSELIRFANNRHG